MANQANLEATLAAIEANPSHWCQTSWHCKTSHCFAGFAECLRLQMQPTEAIPEVHGDGFLIDTLATRDWLGLTPGQWDEICSPLNSLDRLRLLVKEGIPERQQPAWYEDDDDDWDDDDYLDDEYEDDEDEDDDP